MAFCAIVRTVYRVQSWCNWMERHFSRQLMPSLAAHAYAWTLSNTCKVFPFSSVWTSRSKSRSMGSEFDTFSVIMPAEKERVRQFVMGKQGSAESWSSSKSIELLNVIFGREVLIHVVHVQVSLELVLPWYRAAHLRACFDKILLHIVCFFFERRLYTHEVACLVLDDNSGKA